MANTDRSIMTPREIVSELDKYIVGQNEAKRAVAVALRNRWRRSRVPEPLHSEITPKNILMIGPTGVGKTEIARRLARLTDAPFVKTEATKFTEVGYVGRNVESIVRDLMEAGMKLMREQQKKKVRTRAQEAVEAGPGGLRRDAPVHGGAECARRLADEAVRPARRYALRRGEIRRRGQALALYEIHIVAKPLSGLPARAPARPGERGDEAFYPPGLSPSGDAARRRKGAGRPLAALREGFFVNFSFVFVPIQGLTSLKQAVGYILPRRRRGYAGGCKIKALDRRCGIVYNTQARKRREAAP